MSGTLILILSTPSSGSDQITSDQPNINMGILGNQALLPLRLPTIQESTGILFLSIILCLRPATCVTNFSNETDRLALVEFKSRISTDPDKILSSWNDSIHFCSWQGVTCSLRHQRVVSLNLRGLRLSGTISPHVGNLSFLRFINLPDNQFLGQIPQEVGNLYRLRYLNLSKNTLEGEIPVNISYCSDLKTLDMSFNRLEGRIPAKLSSLKKLSILTFARNNLTGEIPRSFGNLSSLQKISLAFNNLKGEIPSDLGRLTSLTTLLFGVNNFVGTIPFELYNISSINVLVANTNDLHGSLPATIGLTLPNLVEFGIGENQFHGTIPASLVNASFLGLLDVLSNNFTGQVPSNLGVLKDLYWLNLQNNFLGSNTSDQDLSFISSLSNCTNLLKLSIGNNNFGGELPSSVGNLSVNLELLILGGNQFFGRIPVELGNLVNLYGIDLEENQFSGTIPSSFGKLQKLQILSLSTNILSGEIPSALGNLSQLSELYLQENQLEGDMTSSLGNFQNLHYLDISTNKLTGTIPPQVIIGLSSLSRILNISQNSLTGSLPQEIGNLKSINALDVSNNQISGEIPDTIGACLSLEVLKLQDNSLQGHIPSSIASLRGIQYLDLSRNNLSGNIPKKLEEFNLSYLNLSFNNLEGEVPTKGVFSNISAFSVVGNSNLCGGILELQLPRCVVQTRKHSSSRAIILSTTIVGSVLIFMVTISLCVFYRKKSRKNPSVLPSAAEKLLRVSYKELFDATQGFSSDSLIGQGGFGSVYKGWLQKYERLVAVKVLNLKQEGASKSFIAECRALRNIRHRNLVKILTYCSIPDFRGNEFKALLFDFMANGSLEMWLHSKEIESGSDPKSLSLLQRLNVAIDVASALHYLHDNCEIQIIHCDLKPSNILLDDGMTAHVGDFGLARLFSKSSDISSQSLTSSIGIKGSIGYIAPEYGLGSEATTKGDVYSYGIILLEMFTGKRPIEESFTDTGFNLHNFVKTAFPERVMQLVDPTLLITTAQPVTATTAAQEKGSMKEIQKEIAVNKKLGDKTNNVQNCILSMLKIGLACSAEFPRDRMNMRDVLRELNHIKDAFLGVGGDYATNISV